LANARTYNFKHRQITQGYSAFASSQPNSEDALRPLTVEINALKQLDAAWPDDSPLPPDTRITDAESKAITDAYFFNLLDQPGPAAIQAIVKNPASAAAAIHDFTDNVNKLRKTAANIAEQFQAVAESADLLNSTVFPPSQPLWEALKKRLTDLGPTPAGWPDSHLSDTLNQVNSVLAAIHTTDAHELQKFAEAGTPPALTLAVCARFPTVHGDADLDVSIFQTLKKNVSPVPPVVISQLGDLWASRMQSVVDPAGAAHLLDLAGGLGLTKPHRELALDYYNARLADLKSRAGAQQSVDQQKQAIQAFLDQTAPVADAPWPLAQDDKQAVRRIAAELALGLHPPPPVKLSSEFQPTTDGSNDYIYVPGFDPGHPMRFKRVHNKTTGSTFYLCTTEVSVGWFIGMFSDPHREVTLRHLLDFTVPGKMCGPSGWRTNFFRGGIEVNHDRSWLAFANHNWDSDDSRYIPSGDGPTGLTPMQYVSPLASMYAAWLVGCRLPTVDEWQSAYESDARDSDDNCSGGNWQKLRAYINGLSPPDISAITCHRFRTELGIETEDGQPLLFDGSLRPDNGDNLWFREVPPNAAGFHDMRGNVAEWVLAAAPDQPAPRFEDDRPLTVADETGSHPVAKQDDPALSTLYTHCMRIGLSTISGKNDDPEKPAPLPQESKVNHHHQFFDVGFRLAMNDPSTPTVPNLVTLVQRLQPVAP